MRLSLIQKIQQAGFCEFLQYSFDDDNDFCYDDDDDDDLLNLERTSEIKNN